jgi:hypothetical protein
VPPYARDGFSFRFAVILGLAFAFTVWQVNMVQQRRADREGGGGGARGGLSGGGPLDGVAGFRAGGDWGMLLGAVAARLELHARVLEVVDGRAAAGEGARLLTLLARPGAAAAAAANESAVAGAWPGALGWRAPLVLFTLHEGRGGGGGLAGARRPRSFLGAGGAGGAPGPGPRAARAGGGRRGGGGGGGAGSNADSWEERDVPRGPRRGKAARAFGAHARGPSLDARSRSAAAPPPLTLQLHVHVPGLTCALAGAPAAPVAFLPPPAALPPCERAGEPLLPFSAPSSGRAREALEAAARASRGALASAPLDAPFLTWPEAVLALLRDVQRLRLAALRAPDGRPVAAPCGGPRLAPCAGAAAGAEAAAAAAALAAEEEAAAEEDEEAARAGRGEGAAGEGAPGGAAGSAAAPEQGPAAAAAQAAAEGEGGAPAGGDEL